MTTAPRVAPPHCPLVYKHKPAPKPIATLAHVNARRYKLLPSSQQAAIHPEQPAHTLSRQAFDSVWAHSVDLLQRGFASGSILTVRTFMRTSDPAGADSASRELHTDRRAARRGAVADRARLRVRRRRALVLVATPVDACGVTNRVTRVTA